MHDEKDLVKMEDRSVEYIQVDAWCTESKRMKIQIKKGTKDMCYSTSHVIGIPEEKE